MPPPRRSVPDPRAPDRKPSAHAAPSHRGAYVGRPAAPTALDRPLFGRIRPVLPIVAVVAGLGLFVYAMFFGSTEEEKVRERLAQLASAVEVRSSETNLLIRSARLKEAFDELLAKEVTIRIPELAGSIAGRRDLIGVAAQAASLWRSAAIDVGRLDVQIDESKSAAHATGNVILQATRHSGEPERDARAVSIRLDKIDGRWRFVSVVVSTKDEEAP